MAELNLYQKLAKIREMSDSTVKELVGHNYMYSNIDNILANVTTGMKKYHISLIPRIENGTEDWQRFVTTTQKLTKDGKPYEQTDIEYSVSFSMTYTWVNDDNPSEVIEVPWYCIGIQRNPSQAQGSALTYNMRYFLLNYFQIAQQSQNDVDGYESKKQLAIEKENAKELEETVNELVKQINEYCMKNPEQKDLVQEFIKQKYQADGKPRKITNVEVARNCLSDFRDSFLKIETKGDDN